MALYEGARLAVLIDTLFNFMAEVADEPLDRPCRGIAKRADCVPFDLFGHAQQHVDILMARIALGHLFHHAPHPAGAFAAWRTLAAAFVLVEIADARDRLDEISRLVHHDDRRRAKAGFQVAQRVEVHLGVHDLMGWNHWHR